MRFICVEYGYYIIWNMFLGDIRDKYGCVYDYLIIYLCFIIKIMSKYVQLDHDVGEVKYQKLWSKWYSYVCVEYGHYYIIWNMFLDDIRGSNH